MLTAIFWANYFLSIKNFLQKISFSRIFFLRNIYSFKKMYGENSFRQNIFLANSCLATILFLWRIFFGKILLAFFFKQNFYKCHCDCWLIVPGTYLQTWVKIGSVTADIFLIWTYVAKTNVVWTNVIVTVGICSKRSHESTFKIWSKSGQ